MKMIYCNKIDILELQENQKNEYILKYLDEFKKSLHGEAILFIIQQFKQDNINEVINIIEFINNNQDLNIVNIFEKIQKLLDIFLSIINNLYKIETDKYKIISNQIIEIIQSLFDSKEKFIQDIIYKFTIFIRKCFKYWQYILSMYMIIYQKEDFNLNKILSILFIVIISINENPTNIDKTINQLFNTLIKNNWNFSYIIDNLYSIKTKTIIDELLSSKDTNINDNILNLISNKISNIDKIALSPYKLFYKAYIFHIETIYKIIDSFFNNSYKQYLKRLLLIIYACLYDINNKLDNNFIFTIFVYMNNLGYKNIDKKEIELYINNNNNNKNMIDLLENFYQIEFYEKVTIQYLYKIVNNNKDKNDISTENAYNNVLQYIFAIFSSIFESKDIDINTLQPSININELLIKNNIESNSNNASSSIIEMIAIATIFFGSIITNKTDKINHSFEENDINSN